MPFLSTIQQQISTQLHLDIIFSVFTRVRPWKYVCVCVCVYAWACVYLWHYYWLLLNSVTLSSRADSLRWHVILHEWTAFYSAFLNIHQSGVLKALAGIHIHIWVILLKTSQNCDIEGKNSKCKFLSAIIWKWKLDISCVHKYKT